jgi:hypothetical protein
MFVALVTLLVCLVGNELHADSQYDKAHAALHATHTHIVRTLAALDSVRRNLTLVDGQVDQTTTALANDTMQLHEVQAALANAQTNVSTQQSSIVALHACLGGVEQSLNALAVGDENSADQALISVEPDCHHVLTADG